VPALAGRKVSVLIWTTTPWTIPSNLAVAFHPEFDYAAYDLEGQTVIVAEGLAARVSEAVGRPFGAPVAKMKGEQLEGIRFRHPIYDRDSVGVLGAYVTLEAGTGVVHTAPGHGADDFNTGKKYGLEIYAPVGAGGRFLDTVELFGGMKVFDANAKVEEALHERARLWKRADFTHQYPHCWRCHNPVIFLATSQWFISMDKPFQLNRTLRQAALDAIDKDVKWIPAWGHDRIYNMVANRPDWCISRQRAWGVPIPAVDCKKCGEALLTPELVSKAAGVFDTYGADAWYERPIEEFLPGGLKCPSCGEAEFERERDILDVWFDSGSSHEAVLPRWTDLTWPADMYLEGSDQHRGWFHSSLLIGVATRGAAPYRAVITHGFTVDAEGKKISKSVGNDVDTQKLIGQYGAEILRLWTIMVDYREDMRISDDMIKRVAEAYRKVRNTIRYLLSNLYDFDPARDTVAENDMDELDRYALARHRQVVARVLEAYDTYEFHLVYHQLVQYAAADLSSFYFDVLKDRLYCDAANGPRRRSAQTVLHRIARELCLLLAPVVPFTADEAFTLLPGEGPGSVHLALFPDREQADDATLARWAELLAVRAEVNKALEEARAAKLVSGSLEAGVVLRAPERTLAPLRALDAAGRVFPGNLANLFIVSSVFLEESNEPLAVGVEHAAGRKCERCWTWSEKVGTLPRHPGVCERCSEVLARP
jgi:isoleucyl-tRNA synthetase